MPIPSSILERIETYRRCLKSYLSRDYKEAQVWQEFIRFGSAVAGGSKTDENSMP